MDSRLSQDQIGLRYSTSFESYYQKIIECFQCQISIFRLGSIYLVYSKIEQKLQKIERNKCFGG